MKRVWLKHRNSSARVRPAIILAAALSLAIHAGLIFALWFVPKHSPLTGADPAQVTVELLNREEIATLSRGDSATNPKITSRARSDRRLNLAPSFKPSFAPKFAPESKAGDIAVTGSTQDGSDFIDDPKSEWGSGAKDFGRVADFVRLDRLYRSVSSRLIYPSILAYRGISGTVNARLVITKKGCDWQHTTISASEPHLRVYILDVLQRTCKQSLAEFARSDRASNVDFSFSFAQTEHNDAGLIQAQNKIVGNVLLFYRNSHASVAEWKLGPIRGLFPIPAVAVDFVWLKLNWDKFVGAPDPMADYKEKTGSGPTS